ncbi:hypothetical protein AVEN_188961-1 [Araneus ventricosus]|uniref:Uncharacterized protein n=1 Tax=Araneus ventricosus TaxID=182803 RepID=A0A4Y2IJH5_ARAVE|nr:hypothetical protein AVEN_188961-1 [Araneus ventricosus]
MPLLSGETLFPIDFVPLSILIGYCQSHGSKKDAIWGGSRHFVRSQMIKTTPDLAGPSPMLRTALAEGHSAPDYDLACSRPTYTAELLRNRVLNPLSLGSKHYYEATPKLLM